MNRPFLKYILLVAFLAIFLNKKALAQDSLVIIYDTLSVADTAKVVFYQLDKYGKSFFESKENYQVNFNADPLRNQDLPYVNTGNLGSPAYSLMKDFSGEIDRFQLHNSFTPYEINLDNFVFLESPVDYSKVNYNQAVNSQSDLVVGASILKNWSEQLSMTFHFSRISQAEGNYTYQSTRNTSLGMGFNYESVNKKYQFRTIYTRNKIQQQYNWGLIRDENNISRISQDEAGSSLNFAVHSKTARGLYYHNDLLINQQYQLFEPSEDRMWNGLLFHEMIYSSNLDHYSDNKPLDAGFDSVSHLLIDDRALRFWYTNKNLSNSLGIGMQLFQNHNIRVGLGHYVYWLDTDLTEVKENELRFWSKVSGPLGEKGDYEGSLELPFYNNNGRIKLDLEARPYLFEGLVNMKFAYSFMIKPPTIQENRLILSQQEVYNNTFNDPIIQRLSVGLSFRDWVKVDLDYFNLENPIYYAEGAVATQKNSNYSAWRTKVQMDFNIWKFHFAPKFWHQGLPDFYQLPTWVGEMDLEFQQSMFKDNLDLAIGSSVRVFDEFRPYEFYPVLGTFAQQPNYLSPEYPILDLYIGMKVQGFRFFFRMDNVLTRFNSDLPLAELTYGNPQFDGYFRAGIVWTFFN